MSFQSPPSSILPIQTTLIRVIALLSQLVADIGNQPQSAPGPIQATMESALLALVSSSAQNFPLSAGNSAVCEDKDDLCFFGMDTIFGDETSLALNARTPFSSPKEGPATSTPLNLPTEPFIPFMQEGPIINLHPNQRPGPFRASANQSLSSPIMQDPLSVETGSKRKRILDSEGPTTTSSFTATLSQAGHGIARPSTPFVTASGIARAPTQFAPASTSTSTSNSTTSVLAHALMHGSSLT